MALTDKSKHTALTITLMTYTNQNGFRKQHSTNHAINYSVTHVQKLILEKNHVFGIFIDLSKAFDTISLVCKIPLLARALGLKAEQLSR